ncbi:methyl-accepting chemotaxis sensory transducer [Denitrovibrio acetiphilus DSM 12809]|uniref:Methyl-accepting chemotaxis sensory transducer n=1 Tax=Denitrovibrio acetiphilus (strain DSM 12809 / NBRC 114555 / N2460) TaxID=522772 RepID=D4H3V9_DENA2|nr:methyl-accepting chemotaxis protein [Denitrovibrio acetiphilus]ADD67270.1 methyl-accepting chemotaxis sensory transducer [Denitrovibrio acetiphilus DSM 12809]
MRLIVKITLFVAVTVLVGMGVLFTVNFFQMKNKLFDAEIARARSFVLAAEGVREYMALAMENDIYDTDKVKHDLDKFLLTVPIVGAMKVMELKSEEVGLNFKVPKRSPRNPKNEPDAVDLKALDYLDSIDKGGEDAPEYVIHDKENGQLRYYRSVRLAKLCEDCHGDPVTSQKLWGNSKGLDITGVKMENWRAGELHGAFEVFLPTSNVYSAVYKNLGVSLLVFLPVTIVILIVLVIINNKFIFKRLVYMGNILQEVASGNFSVQVQDTSSDEVGDLARSLNKMINDVNDAMSVVVDSIASLASTSAELSENAESIAKGAKEQSEQVSSTASAVEEVNSTVVEVAHNAANVSNSAEEASKSVGRGHILVEQTRNMMEKIAETVSESAVTVRKLGESSEQIGQIIQVIDDIADQTNLLALNAAIEAARAGEHGRGFAVVADEVRKLAEKTVNATKEIAEMIQSIQADTGGAVMGMHEGVQQVKEGQSKAEEAKEALDVIKSNVNAVSTEVGMIARATEEQATATEMMAQSIENISLVTDDNSLASSETARAVEQLSHLASELDGLVSRFKLKRR